MVANINPLTESSVDADASSLDGLTDDQQRRLTQQLDDYLVSIENGQPLNAAELAERNPDLADVFQSYLGKLADLYGVAIGFQGSTTDHVLENISSGKMKLGDFTLFREIGRGGMGVVYEARQESLARRVAIKLLPMASLVDSQQVARFKNEAHAAGLLNHPNIVPVYSVGSERGLHYYAMQFIDGVSMDDWVQDCSQYGAWRKIVRWTIDVARALHAAHATGVVHRDVKPSNLMLDQNGKIWITDFGLARCQSDLSLTKSGDLVGTMRYMSPEQARGQHALVDGRTDIYSLAATAYELLSLRPAHDGEDTPAILKMIAEGDVLPIRQIRGDLPRDLETVLGKAMFKGRDGRYETAEAFADDLDRVLAGEPTMARPATIVDRIGRLASKHRSGVFAAVTVGLLGLVGFATSTAIIATWKQTSDANAARATRNEQLARGAVDRLGSQMAELLADIPAADPVRRALLSETLKYYQTFAAIADDDPALREDLAITLGKIGSLQSELGETAQAIESLRRSEVLYSELGQQDRRLRLDWSTSQNNLAQVLAGTGQLEQAAKYFAKAITIQKAELTAATSRGSSTGETWMPHRDEVAADVDRSKIDCDALRLQLAITLNNLGLLLADTSADQQAEQTYLEAIAVLEPNGRPATVFAARQQLGTIYSNLSGLLAKASPERAIAYARQALVGQTDLLESNSSNAKLATQVIVTLNTLGASQSAAGIPSEAIDTLSRAVEIGNQLLDRWPDQPTYRRDLIISLNHLGLAYSKIGNLTEARNSFDAALTLARPLATTFASDAEIHSMLGGVLNNLGFLQQQLGDLHSAATTFDEAIAAQTIAVQLAPEVKRYRQFLRKHRENYRAVSVAGTTS
jgi:tetratricopeptide (TPR) repeat protein